MSCQCFFIHCSCFVIFLFILSSCFLFYFFCTCSSLTFHLCFFSVALLLIVISCFSIHPTLLLPYFVFFSQFSPLVFSLFLFCLSLSFHSVSSLLHSLSPFISPLSFHPHSYSFFPTVFILHGIFLLYKNIFYSNN